jgi:hypothetical protein
MSHDADFQVLWSLLVQDSAVLLVVACTKSNFTELGKDSGTAATYVDAKKGDMSGALSDIVRDL